MEKVDKKRFWLGSILALSGVALLFLAMYLEPKGEISVSVISAAGEIFLIAGALLGLDSYFDFKLKKFLDTQKNTETK